MQCSLCDSKTMLFVHIEERKFFSCTKCKAVLLCPLHYLSPEEEKERYLLHQNDIHDIGYQNFVSPIVQSISREYNANHTGLDFGSGSGPVITSLLTEKGYNIITYDPFFDPNNSALENKYDYIVCCEVMEHFHNPSREFSLLFSLLNPEGKLYCKTSLYNKNINFRSWWYKNDPTHVFFYTTDTLLWIKNRFKFKLLEIREDLIIFGN